MVAKKTQCQHEINCLLINPDAGVSAISLSVLHSRGFQTWSSRRTLSNAESSWPSHGLPGAVSQILAFQYESLGVRPEQGG